MGRQHQNLRSHEQRCRQQNGNDDAWKRQRSDSPGIVSQLAQLEMIRCLEHQAGKEHREEQLLREVRERRDVHRPDRDADHQQRRGVGHATALRYERHDGRHAIQQYDPRDLSHVGWIIRSGGTS